MAKTSHGHILIILGLVILLFLLNSRNTLLKQKSTCELNNRKEETSTSHAENRNIKDAILSNFLIPGKQDCVDLGRTQQGKVLKFTELYNKMKPLYDQKLETSIRKDGQKCSSLHGHTADSPKQALLLHTLINNTRFVRTICETGFFIGYSSFNWLTGNSNTHVNSFDLRNQCGKLTASFLQTAFPGRLDVIWGDSKLTIPAFTKKNPNFKCDLIFIDGGHTYPDFKTDILNLRAHANPRHHILVLDDVPRTGLEGIAKAWKEELMAGRVEEDFKCQFSTELKRGFTVGRYVGL